MGGDDAAIARVRGDQLAPPLGIEEVLPGPGRVGGGDGLGVVGEDGHGGPQAVVIAVLVLEARREALHAGGRVLHEELLVLEQDVVAGIRGVDHVGVLDIGGELLHHALQDALGARAVHLDLDAGVGRLEELGDLLRAREGEGRVPDDLALLLRGQDARVLGPRPRAAREPGGEHERQDGQGAESGRVGVMRSSGEDSKLARSMLGGLDTNRRRSCPGIRSST